MTQQFIGEPALVIEDDPFAQESLVGFLKEFGFTVHCASTFEQATRTLDTEPPFRLAIIDLLLRRDGERRPSQRPLLGLDLLRRIKTTTPQTATVIWTAQTEFLPVITDLILDGHTGIACVIKGSVIDEMRDAVMQTLDGDVYIQHAAITASTRPDTAMLRTLPPELVPLVCRIADQIDQIPPRERAVVLNIFRNTKVIAQDMQISYHTVTNYLDKIYDQLNLKDDPIAHLFRRDTVLVLALLLYRLR